MILVALGTHQQPFERLLALAADLATVHEVIVQHGHSPPPDWCDPARRVAFVDYEPLMELMGTAEAVICHAGVGTIMTVLSLGKIPVVVPRLARYGEHVDDHQVQIADAFAMRGLALVYESGDLEEALHLARAQAGRRFRGTTSLRRAVVEAAGTLAAPTPTAARV